MPVAQNSVFLPEQFLAQMHEALPAHLSFDDFVAACQRPLRRSIRVNTLKISVGAFLDLVSPYGWQLTPVPWCEEGFWIERDDEESLPLGSTAEHLSGLFYIQEASSMLPVAALFADDNQPERVMDVAAAPGSKTTQIAARMNNRGAILANEFSASRVKVLHANISRCGIHNVALTHFDGRVFGAALPEAFDAILLDAPCSGEGVVRKDPDALKNWSVASNLEIAATQRELIDSAFHALRPGGTLVYSTCTLNRDENEDVCLWLKQRYADAVEFLPLDTLFDSASHAATPEGFLHVFPQIYDCEGFFVARLRKTRAVDPLPAPAFKVGNFPFAPVKGREAAQVQAAASKVGLHWDESLRLWMRDKELWLFPTTIEPLIGKVRFSRLGIRLAEIHNKGYRWQHEAVIALAGDENTFALTHQEAEEWYRGRDVYPENSPAQDEVIVTYQGFPLGLAKKVGSRLKNSYPRELVRDGRLFTGNNRTA
ncbi:16S rRNA (cytosine(1407)-C(5))-methyltransferase RsmF [Enterobacter hormaechei]|uniref:16S rRNA (cytosine(1407)-C(5))-methyltransferase RsmF n=1 Tax=Enterobacter cloacae complex sp. 2023EL-00493 TaxID=3058337 RepID=UPI0018D16249|nr:MULTISPECIES: 16S rRNA (cytosine(1407)-C(5))-methyltransferase RsmF [Enterobacter cloacae complex]EKV8269254.1 16S rRNA (cytosine(1407)-C(5))-methyltransferase RsmF [Enterobacter hormaechei]EKV9065760.1 16S rRNA (cytosine(1407)-C(5))-methyltransferase RsmF [Enterobacter hormaechei]ELC6325873.1 16S rRNA (cytosine(1407)-C(5))-methyltransferase RsmF [Enterobacter hormaechei]ELC6588282.1 16S rRNA (cytosine(1407)-C(5))-methyltransferase RsmF [Enterobacter hormaechei]ELC7215164.1 16S rRNA (cytosi